jgi:phosphate transport system permease protein
MMNRYISPKSGQRIATLTLWTCTGLTIAALVGIIAYILVKGLPHLDVKFLSQNVERMGKGGGVFPFIVATLYATGIALLVATPLGVGTAIYLTEYTRGGKLTTVIRFGADCLAGVPSIIFGLFGFVFFVIYLDYGWSMVSGGLTLALMVLPTIIRTSEEAIRAVPREYRDVAFGLGSTRWQMVAKVILPSAIPGILTGIILSIGRSVSETAAVMLTAGSALKTPLLPTDSGRTLAYHFYILAREGISAENAYKTATVLILAILVINFTAYWLMRRFIAKLS